LKYYLPGATLGIFLIKVSVLGIAIKFGRFSQKENNQIRKNVEDFLSITGIDSAEKLLFTSRYPEEKGAINRLKAEHLFCEKLGKH